MNCPICGKEAKTRVYRCAKCAVFVHVACWPKHRAAIHGESEPTSQISPYAGKGKR